MHLAAGTRQQDEYDIPKRSRPIINIYRQGCHPSGRTQYRALTVHLSDRHSTRVKRKLNTDSSSWMIARSTALERAA
ncbi:Uncharacterized protein HZ326_0852 [Fusarium oxysporum f. sp. albedinis]|nr:Uncharacterized protein HZ326_0852 [Fusarium oxysporum f. sp. albedinis]